MVQAPFVDRSWGRSGKVHVMSGQAIEAGLVVVADAFRVQTGTQVTIDYATTPLMRQRLAAAETPDIVIAPPALLDELTKAGRLDATTPVAVGRVGVGVAVRKGAPKPDVSTVNALKRAILDADSVIYNRASSGLYVEALLQRLGIAEQIQAKDQTVCGRGDGRSAGQWHRHGNRFHASSSNPPSARPRNEAGWAAPGRGSELYDLCRGPDVQSASRFGVRRISRDARGKADFQRRRDRVALASANAIVVLSNKDDVVWWWARQGSNL
jgi:hypothetical protein